MYFTLLLQFDIIFKVVVKCWLNPTWEQNVKNACVSATSAHRHSKRQGGAVHSSSERQS